MTRSEMADEEERQMQRKDPVAGDCEAENPETKNSEINQLEEEVLRGYRTLTRALIRSRQTITTMESCTAGMLASLITDTEGSSEILKGPFVTYSNEAKIRQGVPEEVIAEYGVYSEETARAMAEAARAAFGAGIAIGITGTFSNADPANADSRPGLVCYAFAFRDRETLSFSRGLQTTGERRTDKMLAARAVIRDLLPLIADPADEKAATPLPDMDTSDRG